MQPADAIGFPDEPTLQSGEATVAGWAEAAADDAMPYPRADDHPWTMSSYAEYAPPIPTQWLEAPGVRLPLVELPRRPRWSLFDWILARKSGSGSADWFGGCHGGAGGIGAIGGSRLPCNPPEAGWRILLERKRAAERLRPSSRGPKSGASQSHQATRIPAGHATLPVPRRVRAHARG